MTTSWGLSLTPGVSSSKNRKSPALAAGIGASFRRLFSLSPNTDQPFVERSAPDCIKRTVPAFGGLSAQSDVLVCVACRVEGVLDTIVVLSELGHVRRHFLRGLSLHNHSCD